MQLSLLATAALDILELGLSLVVLLGLPGIYLLLALPVLLRQGLKLTHAWCLGTIVHQSLHSLFALEATGFKLVQWRVHNLAVNALNFAVLRQIDLHILVLLQELTYQQEEAVYRVVEQVFLHLSHLGHFRVLWLNHGLF